MAQHKITPPSTYVLILVALFVCTGLTVVLSFAPLGRWHMIVGLAIATAKATLVFLVFMHLMHSHRLTWIFAAGGIVWLAILLGLTLADYMTRPGMPDEAGWSAVRHVFILG